MEDKHSGRYGDEDRQIRRHKRRSRSRSRSDERRTGSHPSSRDRDRKEEGRHRRRHESRHDGRRRKHSHKSRHGTNSEQDGRHDRKIKQQAENIAKVLQETGRIVGYEDDENPFGDTNLSKAFVWHKKIEKQLDSGVSEKAFSSEVVQQQHERRVKEIDEVKKRRLDRAREVAQRQEEVDLIQRERILSEAAELEEKEENFHTQQAKIRSEIRLKEGRAKPVDVFYNILYGISSTDINLQNPNQMLHDLDVSELEDLKEAIGAHLELDSKYEDKKKFWTCALLLCEKELLKRRHENSYSMNNNGASLHSSLEEDVRSLLSGKGTKDLEKLRDDIQMELANGAAGNEDYWGAVLERIKVQAAERYLLDMYAKQPAGETANKANAQDAFDGNQEAHPGRDMLSLKKIEEHEHFSHEYNEAERRFRAISDRMMGPEEEGDENFIQEVPVSAVEGQIIKPQFSNRVHAGYEWTKYNQTHYDQDNPPPKVIQGYKFNIFYSEKVKRTPTYKFTKDPESFDNSMCIIRFHAGAPFQDLAFRVVNKEWDFGHKTGFKCSFDRGILHLHFNFKRQRYRK